MREGFVKVDEWIEQGPRENETIVGYDGKLIIIPFDKIFKREELKMLETFIIRKESYVKRLGDTIVPYINYFINFYDKEDMELATAYLAMKFHIDNRKKRLKLKSFISLLYSVLFTDSIKEKIEKMVDDNYQIDVNSKNKKNVYPESLKYNNDHGKAMMKISTAMKLMVPVLFHYLVTYNMLKKVPLNIIYEKLFTMFDEHIDVYSKLYTSVDTKVQKNYKRNHKLWDQQEVLGRSALTKADEILKVYIIGEAMFRYTFDKNFIHLNAVVINKQLSFFNREKYKYNLVEMDNKDDGDGLSSIDKFEINAYKIDESLVMLSDVNIKETIKKIRKSMNIELDKDEIQFYKDHHKIDKFQVQLVYYYYAKYFGGYRDLKLLSRNQYIKLLVLLKRRLQFQGLVYLPQVITANIEKLNKRTIQNSKFRTKIQTSTIYQTLVNEKFTALEELDKDQLIISLLSTINNTKFSMVDYDQPEKLGEVLEIQNTDILLDESLHFLNQL